MNTYIKFVPNVFLAKCQEQHEKGSTILVTTKYGKENECVVFNLIGEKNGFFYYSIVRADGFNVQEYAKKRAERLLNASSNSEKKSTEFYNKSNVHRDFLSLAEPIKVGHHSEKRHRKIIDQANNNMRKSVELSDKAEDQKNRAEYWKSRESVINLSMPESIEFYQFKLDEAKKKQEGLKNGSIERSHSFSLAYATKEVKEFEKKLKIANQLWA